MEHIATTLILLIFAFAFTGVVVALVARSTRRHATGKPGKTSGDAAAAWYAVQSGASSAASDGGGCDGGAAGGDGGGCG